MITAIESYVASATADQLDFLSGIIAQRRRQLNTLASLSALQPPLSESTLADSLLGSKTFNLYHLQPGNYTLPPAWIVAFERTFGLPPSANVNVSGIAATPDGKTLQFVLRSSGPLSAAFLGAERIKTLHAHYNDYVASHTPVPKSSTTPTTSQKVREAQKLLQELGLL